MTALRLYTDGSCYPPGTVGGWAWILVSEHPVASGSGKTPGASNHQRCEVTAAIEGLTYLVTSGIREVELLSDSRHVVGGMSSTGCTGCKGWAHSAAARGWRDARGKPLKNPDLWERLLELAGCLAVTWRHVPGHRPKTDTSDDALHNREAHLPRISNETRRGLSVGVSLRLAGSRAAGAAVHRPVTGFCCRARCGVREARIVGPRESLK